MGRLSVFDNPLLLGFEEVERTVERLTRSANDGYPPYNIEQMGSGSLRITLAVAGFSDDQLSVTVEANQLVVRGRQIAGDGEQVFLHRGIAARPFQRSFVLADGIDVTGASLEKGLLHIDLARPPVASFVRSVEIKPAADKHHVALDVGHGDS
ncbi:MAG: Hsp20 family protein [Alphaproteobacteria bacterium]|nr:Hsp20 family protein [Alphaproteobacteria bacterium]